MRPNVSAPLYLQVYDIVKKMIVTGQLRPGLIVTEGQLAEQLGVSRTPIREATKRLVSEGLLQSSRSGLVVYSPSLEDIAQIYVTRSCLEGFAAHLAALDITPAVIGKLNQILDEVEPAVKNEESDVVARENSRFHNLICETGGNRRLTELVTNLEPVFFLYRRYSLIAPENLRQSLVDHREIVRLLEKGDPVEVERAVRHHVLRAGDRVVTALSLLEKSETRPQSSPTMQLLTKSNACHEVEIDEIEPHDRRARISFST